MDKMVTKYGDGLSKGLFSAEQATSSAYLYIYLFLAFPSPSFWIQGVIELLLPDVNIDVIPGSNLVNLVPETGDTCSLSYVF